MEIVSCKLYEKIIAFLQVLKLKFLFIKSGPFALNATNKFS